MKLLLTALSALLITNISLGQNANNYIQIYTNAGINFTIDEPASLETPQTITNAITIRLRCRKKASNVYARISNFNVPPGFYATNSPLYLDWTSDTSPNTSNLSTVPIQLEVYDKLLFTQPKMSQSPSYYQYNYALKLDGLSYDYPPGNYNFTILFTMTQP